MTSSVPMNARITLAAFLALALAGCGRATSRAELANLRVQDPIELGAPLAEVVAHLGRPEAVVPLASGTFALQYRRIELEARIPGRSSEKAETVSYVVRRDKVIANASFHDAGESRGASLSPPLPPLAPRSALVTLALVAAGVVGWATACALNRRGRRAAVRLGLGLVVVAAGAFGHERRGPAHLDAVSEGSPVSEVVHQHGVPDETLALPEDQGQILSYTMRDRRDDILWGSEESSSLSYLVQNGRVVRAGPVVHELVAEYGILRFYETDRTPTLDAATAARTIAVFGIVLALVARRIERRAKRKAAAPSP